jgi:hypothetical protein
VVRQESEEREEGHLKNRIYKWRRHLNGDAQAIGEWLESLPDMSAERIIKEARKIRSPAHAIFEWSDTEAAHQFRMVQARVMVQSLHVEIVDAQNEVIEVNAFIQSADRGRYVPLFKATEDEVTAAEGRFLDLISRLESRYAHLQMAKPVILAIRQVRNSASRKKRKAA